MKPKLKKQLSTLIKIAVSAVLIWLVFRKLDLSQIGQLLKTTQWLYFGLAIFFFVISQLTSVFRFDIFIRTIGVRLNFKTNIQLYLLGMFYNFFLPGGVGGDAYKIYLLNKSHKKSIKTIGQVVFIERFIGVLAILFLASILIFFVQTPLGWFWSLGFGIGGIITTIIFIRWIIKYLHTYKKRIHLVFFYSLGVQFSQLICVIFILKSFQIQDNYLIYMVLFLISSVLSVISFAGIGIREAVFFYGAKWFEFNPDLSAAVALSFSIFTAVVSFFGIIYLFSKIQLKNK